MRLWWRVDVAAAADGCLVWPMYLFWVFRGQLDHPFVKAAGDVTSCHQ